MRCSQASEFVLARRYQAPRRVSLLSFFMLYGVLLRVFIIVALFVNDATRVPKRYVFGVGLFSIKETPSYAPDGATAGLHPTAINAPAYAKATAGYLSLKIHRSRILELIHFGDK